MPRRSVSFKWTDLSKRFGMEEDINKLKSLLLPFIYYYAQVNPAGARDFVRYYYDNDPQGEDDKSYHNNIKETRRAAEAVYIFSPDCVWEKLQEFGGYSDADILAKIKEIVYTKVSN